MVLIVVEGPSKSGKSTLIEKLHKTTRIPIWKRPSEIEEFKEKTKSWDLFVLDELSLINSINWKNNDLIIDRHPAVSEWVYKEIFGRKSAVPWLRISLVPENTIFIFLIEEVETLIERGGEKEKAAKEVFHYSGIATTLAPHRPVLILPAPHKMKEEALLEDCLAFIKQTE